MRYRFILSILLLSPIFVIAQSTDVDDYFYYYKGQMTALPIDYSRISVVTNGMLDYSLTNSPEDWAVDDYSLSLVQDAVYSDSTNVSLTQTSLTPIYMTSIVLANGVTMHRYNRIIDSLKAVSNVLQVLPSFEIGGKRVDITNNFYVKLKSPETVSLLEEMAAEYHIDIVGCNEYMPLWYTLSCTNSSLLSSIDAANAFYESGLFELSEPEFSYYDLAQSNDTYYSLQWGINNTGQYNVGTGIDINVQDAWEVTKGRGIKIAVYDQGIELTHPDLANNISSLSFDAQTKSSPSRIRGSHGTACAGIIGAVQDNGKGITGVAPESELLSVSLNLMIYDTPQQVANGFNWAWRNGADVISNSWGGYARSSIIDEALYEAMTKGRNGKGTVIVFAAGNSRTNNASITYPGNLYPDILVVGGMSYSGERKSFTSSDGEDWWQSCYGSELDIVAPCVKIYTTDLCGRSEYSNDDYCSSFNGTSSACPHVAGVAALVLSANPNLTAGEVGDIIENTAQKIRTDLYSYTNYSGRPNGKWNNQMGYGLVDASAAVSMALSLDCSETHIANQSIINDRTVNGCNVVVENVEVRNSAQLLINATDDILLKPTIKVKKGAVLRAL